LTIPRKSALVSKSFNSWNCVRKDPRLTEGSTSRFVSRKDKTGPQWRCSAVSAARELCRLSPYRA
jgi:hypothetical protein